MKYLVVILLFTLSSLVSASWDDGQGVQTGVISSVDVTGGNNYGFRVYLGGAPKMCAGGDKWAYLNESDSNYSVLVSTLLAAFASGYKVTVHSNTLSGTTHCHIGYIMVLK